MNAPVYDLTIARGKTFEYAFLYSEDASNPLYADIAAITDTAPVTLNVPAHGLPDGWPVRIEGVATPSQLNTAARDLQSDMSRVVDADHVLLAGINGSSWRDYRGGGQVVYAKPFDLTGCHARATVRDRAGGNVLFRWHSSPDMERDGAIEMDAEGCQIVLIIDAATSAALPWRRGVYELELIDAAGRVHAVTAISRINVTKEVTT
ncbi:hypothetical protein SAMN05216229_102120 [Geopseudomonas sagittaria]|uniref:Uncharacterized protein n=1 Tax=Geopseudomonas sagittaria TaxID=1135990 RepID=A0A1I5PZI9_9GAMM|nr:hypothetical protein [Pseudomonas sagittaria]SFP39483.1 hypothetical protein SAMN05216229_102120 [Pseudomonas sagittaria]